MKALYNKSVLLTGASGFVGTWLLSTLVKLNNSDNAQIKIYCLSRRSQESFGNDNKNFKLLQGDIRTCDLKGYRFDFIIHAATPVVDKIEDNELYSVVIDGTKNILNTGADRVLYVSSGGVYGKQPPEIDCFSEELKCNPVDMYGKAKLEAEKLCRESDINCVIVRPFAFLGPHLPLNAHFAAGNFINDVLHNRKIIINSDGTALRSYMYPTDMCEYLFSAMLNGKNGDIFNVGSPDAISIRDLAIKISTIAGKEPSNVIVKGKNANHNRSVYVPCVERIECQLGLKAKVTIEEAIKRTLKFYE